MKHEYNKETESLKIELTEEIDMSSCKVLRNIMDGYIIKYSPKECILDMEKVSFMDSSGLGLIMGRYNLIKMLNSKMTLLNPGESIKKILSMTELVKDIKII